MDAGGPPKLESPIEGQSDDEVTPIDRWPQVRNVQTFSFGESDAGRHLELGSTDVPESVHVGDVVDGIRFGGG